MTEKEFNKNIVPILAKKLGIKNLMAVPKLVKIVINCGMGEAALDKKLIDNMLKQLAVIAGQKPIVTRSKKAISSFKIREGMPIGIKVTLRHSRMYDFLSKFVGIVLPRVRDFRGVKKTSFDGEGNYSIGLTEQLIFPELDYSMIDKVRGFQITFVTTAKTNSDAATLLTHLGIPFEKE